MTKANERPCSSTQTGRCLSAGLTKSIEKVLYRHNYSPFRSYFVSFGARIPVYKTEDNPFIFHMIFIYMLINFGTLYLSCMSYISSSESKISNGSRRNLRDALDQDSQALSQSERQHRGMYTGGGRPQFPGGFRKYRHDQSNRHSNRLANIGLYAHKV